VPQIAAIYRVVEALRIPALSRATFEADDVLATVARITEELDGHCFIVTADKDCRQLISDRVKLYNIRKNESSDRESLQEQWGIAPQQVIDYRGSGGRYERQRAWRAADRPASARQLLEKYGTLEGICST